MIMVMIVMLDHWPIRVHTSLCSPFVDHQGKCTINYYGSGSEGELFPITLQLEDYPVGTHSVKLPKKSGHDHDHVFGWMTKIKHFNNSKT